MKIRNSSRITAIVLALVMLLPLISIPTFAAPTEEQILYKQDFSSYADLDQAGIQAKVKTEWVQSVYNLESRTVAGNTYLRFPMAAYVTPGSVYDSEYYMYSNYTRWEGSYPNYPYANFNYDPETATLTIAHKDEGVDPIVLEVNTASADPSGKFGTVSYGDKTWEFTTGYYAACAKFGDGNAVDRWASIFFGEKEFYTEDDIEVIQGTKKVGDLKAEPKGFTAAEHGKVVVQYKAMIEPGSAGTLNMQLNHIFDANGGVHNFGELFNVNLATGACTGLFNGITMPVDTWIELTFIIDLVGGTVQGLYDGELKGTANFMGNDSVSCAGGSINSFSISKIMKAAPSKMSGAWCVDDLMVLTGDAASGMLKFVDYVNDFESATVGGAVPGFAGMNANYKVAELEGSKVWAMGSSIDGTGTNNANPTLNTKAWAQGMPSTLTIQSDFYIPTGVNNQFQIQMYPNAYMVVNADGSKGNGAWGDIFVLKSKDGVATVGRESNPAMYPLPYDEWFTITLEFDLSTNTYDIFLDGSLIIPGQKVNTYKEIIGLNANAIIFGKENSAAKDWNSGTMYADNISVKAETYQAVLPSEWNIFEDLLNFELWDGDNAEIRPYFIEASYSNPTELFPIYNEEDWLTTALQLDIKATADAEAGLAETNVDLMVRPAHPGYSKNAFDQVILSADYIVSEDAEGSVEVQLFNAHKFQWTHLAQIDTANCMVNGVAFEKGEEFNITTVVDLKAGTFNVYFNNFLINSGKVEADGLSAGEWSIAKVMKDQPAYAGNIVITDATITVDYAEEKAENDLYLYEQENMKTIDASILTAVKAASIRLSDPTGLRFATEIDVEALMEVYSGNIKVGTVIAPADYVAAAGAFTKEALATLGYATNYLDIKAEIGNWYQGGNTTGALDDGTYFTASIVNILEDNLTRDFAAIGYVEYTVNGETVTLYCDEYHVANVADIAAAALATGEYDAYADILNKYIAE